MEDTLLFIAILFSIITGFTGGVPSAASLSGFALILVIRLYVSRDIKSLGLIKAQWFKNMLLGVSFGILTAIAALQVYLNFPETAAHFFQLPIIFSEKTGIESREIISMIFPISYIIGSLIHELFYRGFLQSRLTVHIKPFYSILLAAGLFGWGHYPEGIYSVIIGFYEGIICGTLFHKTGSIIAPWSFRAFHIGAILIILGVL